MMIIYYEQGYISNPTVPNVKERERERGRRKRGIGKETEKILGTG